MQILSTFVTLPLYFHNGKKIFQLFTTCLNNNITVAIKDGINLNVGSTVIMHIT